MPAAAHSTERVTALAPQFEEDMACWVRQVPQTARRIWELMKDVKRSPFTGIGKPEPLKSWRENTWSRRINETDRLVYAVHDDRIEFLQARYHYVP